MQINPKLFNFSLYPLPLTGKSEVSFLQDELPIITPSVTISMMASFFFIYYLVRTINFKVSTGFDWRLF